MYTKVHDGRYIIEVASAEGEEGMEYLAALLLLLLFNIFATGWVSEVDYNTKLARNRGSDSSNPDLATSC
jgi:hypothetical protein